MAKQKVGMKHSIVFNQANAANTGIGRVSEARLLMLIRVLSYLKLIRKSTKRQIFSACSPAGFNLFQCWLVSAASCG